MNDSSSRSSTASDIPAWAQHLEEMRRQRNAEQISTTATDESSSPTAPASEEAAEAQPQVTAEERELAYQRYLQTWQRQHNITPEAQHANATQIMFGDEWQRDAEEILRHEDHRSEQTVLMQLKLESDVQQTLSASTSPEQDLFDTVTQTDTATPTQAASYHVTVLAPPVDAHTRVALMDESVLLRELQEKLRPHLSDAVAGVVKTTMQRHLQTMIQELQQEIPQQLSDVIEEVMTLYLQRALEEIKAQAGIVKKVS
ncbi:MAG: hypothetical protein Q4G42_02440 [Neisseria sp.]|nr:hypothetical protein [Neisseria sp.]